MTFAVGFCPCRWAYATRSAESIGAAGSRRRTRTLNGASRDGDETLGINAVRPAVEIPINARVGQSGRCQQILHLLSGIDPMGELKRACATRADQCPAVVYARPIVDDFVPLE